MLFQTQSEKHSNTVVDNLRLQLKDAAKEFQDVLTLRTDNLKGQDNRRQLFSSTSKKNGEMQSKLQSVVGDGALGREYSSGWCATPEWHRKWSTEV